jgi:hypothetical protein
MISIVLFRQAAETCRLAGCARQVTGAAAEWVAASVLTPVKVSMSN